MAQTPEPTTAAAPTSQRQLLVVLALILALIAIGWWYRFSQKPTADKQATQAAIGAVAQSSDQAAIAQLKGIYDDAASREGKAEAATHLAARYASIDDHRNALKYYREAASLNGNQNIDIILGVAVEADAMNDKGLAREYYQKAVDYYSPLLKADPSLQNLVDRFKARIAELK